MCHLSAELLVIYCAPVLGLMQKIFPAALLFFLYIASRIVPHAQPGARFGMACFGVTYLSCA